MYHSPISPVISRMIPRWNDFMIDFGEHMVEDRLELPTSEQSWFSFAADMQWGRLKQMGARK